MTALRYVAIHGSDNIQSLGDGVGCDRPAKFPYRDFFDLGTEEALFDALRGTEIDGPDDFRLAVHPLGLAQVVVRLTVHDLFGEARHI